jgi:hypothetical protein
LLSRPNLLPFYILDPWFPAVTFSSSSYNLTTDLEKGRSLFNSNKVILHVDSLYVDAIEAVESRAALSASFPEFMPILNDIEFEARL